jgi:hypothetical protein
MASGESAAQAWRELMNLYEFNFHGTDSIYLLAPAKYRALELVRGCQNPGESNPEYKAMRGPGRPDHEVSR